MRPTPGRGTAPQPLRPMCVRALKFHDGRFLNRRHETPSHLRRGLPVDSECYPTPGGRPRRPRAHFARALEFRDGGLRNRRHETLSQIEFREGGLLNRRHEILSQIEFNSHQKILLGISTTWVKISANSCAFRTAPFATRNGR